MSLMIKLLWCCWLVHEGLAGFIHGAPCSHRNTAVLDARGCWYFPRDLPVCVDISHGVYPVPPSLQITRATTLYSDNANLQGIPYSAIIIMPRLELVDLSFNRLRRVEKDAFVSLTGLKTLLLEGNRLRMPRRTPLLNAPALKTLSLSDNKIRKLYRKTFWEMASVRVLYLDRNFLREIDEEVLSPLKELKYLHLAHNQLKTLPDMSPWPRAVVVFKGNPFNDTRGIR